MFHLFQIKNLNMKSLKQFVERLQTSTLNIPILFNHKTKQYLSLSLLDVGTCVIVFVLKTFGDDVTTYTFTFNKETALISEILLFNKTDRTAYRAKLPDQIDAIVDSFVFLEDDVKEPNL